ncbi:MAG: type II secretion system F family protein [Phycisphaerales bacterium]|nr:type II secretion system F family protein [Phycisphaerales bacterium]
MTHFAYTAVPLANPSARVVADTATAADERSLRDSLLAKGLLAVQVRPVSVADAVKAALAGGGVRGGDGTWFFSMLRTLLVSKVPVESALGTLEELAPRPRLKRACAGVRAELRRGASLADAVAAVPGLASLQHLAVLRSGGDSGRLDHAVTLIDQSLRTAGRIRRAVLSQLTYPLILVVASVLAVWFLSVAVIPRFAETLSQLGAEMPWQTRLTMAASGVLMWLVPLAAAAAAGAWIARARLLGPAARAKLDALVLRTPVLGSVRWHAQAATLTDVAATMVEGGADVLSAVRQAEQSVTSPTIAARLAASAARVRTGADLGEALRAEAVLPPAVGAIVQVGLRSGELGPALRRAADLCLEQQETATSRLLALLQPTVIVVLAGAVGWVVYSLIVGMLAVTNMSGL